jgi:hypothetical protein
MQRIKLKLTETYLLPQEKKWIRFIDALAAVFCFVSSVIVLYLLKTEPDIKLPATIYLVVWISLLCSLPLWFLLYRESNLKKYERLALVLFILASSISLLFSVISGFSNT